MVQNVLFISHHDGYLGSSKSLINLLQGLSAYPIRPFVIVPKKSLLAENLECQRVPYRILPVTNWETKKKISLRRKIYWIKETLHSIKQIRESVRAWNIDLIYSNSSIFPVGLFSAVFEHIPHIWHIREFGDLDYSFKYILPRIITIRLIQRSTRIVCNSEAVKHYHFHKTHKRVHVIYNGIATKKEFDEFFKRKQQQEKHEGFVFCMVGSISTKKGTETAIKALSKLVSKGITAKLIIAGNGLPQYIEQCKSLVEDLNLSLNVKFLDYVHDPYEVYYSSDCLLMCSEYEAMGRVTVEAMSACLPVIGKHSGGTPELIEHGKTGYLYHTFEELVEAMEKIVKNTAHGRELGHQGWKLASQRFTIEEYGARVFQVINSIA